MTGFIRRFLYGSFIIWQRDMKRMLRDKHQFYGSFARPVLWLLVLGMGLRPVFKGDSGIDYIQFIFPGIVAMSLIFSATWSGISIIWDREFGFLKEILVAPIPRTSIVTGKIMGGATQAMVQGGITLLFAPMVGVKISPGGFAALLGIMGIISFSLSSMGIALASRIYSYEGFGTISNFVIMPLFFLSGAVYPIQTLPAWLKVIVSLNPVTYGVDLMRGAVLGVFQFSIFLDLIYVTGFGVIMAMLAVFLFRRY
jgi:ABC-2 type transport system permease protein